MPGQYPAKPHGDRIFFRKGLRPCDVDLIRDCILKAAVLTHTGMDFLYGLALDELARIMKMIRKMRK